MKKLLLVFFSFFSIGSYTNVEAQLSEEYYFDDNFNIDKGRSIVQMIDGTIYFAGFSAAIGTNDFVLKKINTNNQLIWSKTYVLPYQDYCFFVTAYSETELILIGETNNVLGNTNIRFLKVDTAGLVLVDKIYSEAGKNSSLKYLQKTTNNELISCGYSTDDAGSNDALIVRFDANGDTIWTRRYGISGKNEYADMILELDNGDFVFSEDVAASPTNVDIALTKIDNEGTLIWQKKYETPIAEGCQALVKDESGFTIVGEGFPSITLPYQFLIMKTDSEGNLISRFDFGNSTKSDAVFSVLNTADKGLILTGYSNSYRPGPVGVFVLKLDSNNQIINPQTFGGSGIGIGYQIIENKIDGGYIVAGSSNIGTHDDFILIKITANEYPNAIEENNTNLQLQVYPNPANTVLYLKSNLKINKIYIKDAVGKTVYNTTQVDDKLTINFLENGIYFITIANHLTQATTKFIVQR